ncbi:FtsP/CotA-like multicopper oxidase with cupredoxin domain [Prosthecobacter fusiformis]|uniref:FtsP/CotA-like multicopper oxidase with cupredoxin domain n=1 Tax=Prosthecobacter fusiformis TaxID=48464 RepID=A0A4R7SP93_9BACT|nr:multicopper oxidase domain-containing protein [Prosthecobacter fusiformis]TDU81032.1 FtsP/CotA-like multicopper oxidase with cupredoxin domain [Prosthecobacter fusiformis]
MKILLCLAAFWLPLAIYSCDDCKKKRPTTGPVVEYDLYITEQTVSPAGKPIRGLTVNGGIPGPTLRFREGDFARIRVHNQLKDEETSTHWHGLLLPNEMDGVPHVTTPPILPGQTHTFEFEMRHSGTYWYHSHTHLQEQSGVYGSIVVLPRGGEPVQADREQVLVLSDWTNIDPHEVQRMLMRGSDYFGLMRRNSQSILGAAKQGMLKDYFSREWSRMMHMDVSDVGYHAFLINGQRSTEISGKPGERIRLRLINAAAATYFYLHSSAGPMTIVAADGPPVQPVQVERLFMAIAETYDVIITIPASGRYELRATTQDGSGHASAFFGEGKLTPANDPPRPNLYQMNEMLKLALEEKDDDPRASLNLPRPGSPYRLLKATHNTTLPAKLPRRKITLHLTGDMNRYIWGFDGKTISQEPYVMIKKGEIFELELINDTMMHHPIHLHGHFFRLLMGQGARSPLKHTVDVPPMSSRMFEFEANEEKDWMFHCHILYHMMSGMARVFRYEGEGASAPSSRNAHSLARAATDGDHSLARAATGEDHSLHHGAGLGEHSHDMAYVWGAASIQSHMSEGLLTWMNPKNDLLLGWEVGWENVDKTEYEVDAFYQRYFNANFQAFIGARFTNEDAVKNRAAIGFNYRLPLMAWAEVSLDSEGDARIALSKRFQLTARLGVFGEVEYDTHTRWEWSAGADYTLTRHTSLITQYHSEYGLGAGVLIRF